ncbi:MAG: VRR-NUC domain-containing protein [Hyphomicrobiaceae bacterium]|nr:VRR-NUC domain-containing protein [Hyphomicrobiaceae bacterium]
MKQQKKKQVHHEDIVQGAVINHLRYRRKPGVTFFAVPNGGFRSKHEAAIMKSLGVRAGVPDIILIANGHTYGLELKREKGGRTSDAQDAMMAEITAAGGTCAVAAGVDAAVGQLEAWGLIRPTTNFAKG